MSERRARRWPGWLTSLAVVIVLVLVNAAFTIPYYVESPGDVTTVGRYLRVPDDRAHPPQGTVSLVTVRVLHAHPFDAVWGWLDPSSRVVPQKDVIGSGSSKQFLEANKQLMDESQTTASAVALSRAGYTVKLQGAGAQVASVTSGTPADGSFRPGDVITKVDDKDVRVSSDVVDDVRAVPPGTVVHLEVTGSDGAVRPLDITTAANPDGSGKSFLGVSVQTKDQRFDTPFPVTFSATGIGGPSAGLAFTLSILDDLTPGELTDGKKVAATGEIALDGRVYPIGGLEQKVAAVKHAHADVFLVPKGELAEAKRYAGSLDIIGVDTVDEAVRALAGKGGDVSGIPAPAPMVRG